MTVNIEVVRRNIWGSLLSGARLLSAAQAGEEAIGATQFQTFK
jgi:hypothetical protein